MLEDIWNFLYHGVGTLGYPGIVGLMALESSFFPFPSEVVVPPGGALAKEGSMSLLLVIACGIAGSVAGALFNYFLAVRLGRPFCLKYGKYFLLSEKKFRKSEAFFRRHGEIGTFIGRLVPGVRQVISFPAGLARMNLGRFCFFTALGSGIWVVVLALAGYYLGAEIADDLHLMKKHSLTLFLYMVPALVLIVLIYVWWYRRRPAGEGDRADAGEEEA